VDYEDDEILWVEENDNLRIYGLLDTDTKNRFQNANLSIEINYSKGTFDVIKNKWGNTFKGVPLDYLDDFLDFPAANWKQYIINESKKKHELKLVTK
jgi:hypothetical protein